ncbi:MAG: putative phage-encoded protein [Candidatus Tokpelaia sp. JSC189]|nr:MAG: putative phage-encoded protein [Candidatus Tokpelaia sp. JSC189]
MIDRYFLQASINSKEFLNDPEAMRGILLNYTEKVIALKRKIKEDKPKTSFYEQFINAGSLYGLQNAACVLHCRPNLFIRWLKENYLFYQGRSLVSRVGYIEMGIFEIKSEREPTSLRKVLGISIKEYPILSACRELPNETKILYHTNIHPLWRDCM